MEKEQSPHVAALHYAIETAHPFGFVEEAKLEGRFAGFAFEFRGHHAVFYPERGSTESEVRGQLEPALEAWYVHTLIRTNLQAVSFRFLWCQMSTDAADGSDAPPSAPVITGILFDAYPTSPAHVTVDQCTHDLAEHYSRSLANPLSILMHAYAMVTRVEYEYGGRMADASRALKVTQACLRKVRRLSTERGLGGQARKYEGKGPRIALTPDESKWLKATMRALVERAWLVSTGSIPSQSLTAGGASE